MSDEDTNKTNSMQVKIGIIIVIIVIIVIIALIYNYYNTTVCPPCTPCPPCVLADASEINTSTPIAVPATTPPAAVSSVAVSSVAVSSVAASILTGPVLTNISTKLGETVGILTAAGKIGQILFIFF